MRLARMLLTCCGAVALVAAAAVPALADPPKGLTPRPGDVVGVGGDTLQFLLDQFSHDYNKANPGAATLLYSWDPADPATGKIVTKAGCKPIARPDGSSAGISALEKNASDPADPSALCVDFAGSSRAPESTDPACTTGGVCFLPVAGDAVTWAARDAASGGTDAPASLTAAQLMGIYQCSITNWAEVGGQNAPIEPFLPQTSSGTSVFWLTALGGGSPITPGPCVSDDSDTLQDNEGINPVLDNPEAIVPYSIADYVAQVYHDASCTQSSCTGSHPCHPTGTQNRFGCDEHGVLGLGAIGGTGPLTQWPAPSPPCPTCAINPMFPSSFERLVYAVVRHAPTSHDIPAYLAPFFAPKTGYACHATAALNDIKKYGFLQLPVRKAAPGSILSISKCGLGNWVPGAARR